MTVYLAHTRKVHYVYLSVTPDCVQNNSRYLIGSLRHPLTVVSDMNVKTMQFIPSSKLLSNYVKTLRTDFKSFYVKTSICIPQIMHQSIPLVHDKPWSCQSKTLRLCALSLLCS